MDDHALIRLTLPRPWPQSRGWPSITLRPITPDLERAVLAAVADAGTLGIGGPLGGEMVRQLLVRAAIVHADALTTMEASETYFESEPLGELTIASRRVFESLSLADQVAIDLVARRRLQPEEAAAAVLEGFRDCVADLASCLHVIAPNAGGVIR